MKRAMCLILAASLCCPLLPRMAFGADYSAAEQTVRALGILSEIGSGTVNRGEFAKMLVSASEYKDEVSGESVGAIYPDVPKTHWAAEYIRIAAEMGWMTGSINGNFRVNDGIRTEEAAAALLELLGYDPASLVGIFPQAQISKAKAIGLADGISFEKGQYLTKQDCVYLFYNLMNTKTASGQIYGGTLGYSLSGDTLSYASVVSEDLEGPFVLQADGALVGAVPFPVGAVYRNGAAVTAADAKAYDVYYYNEEMQTVWLYGNHVTGTYSAAAPNTVAPETATVAGTVYKLEPTAAYKLSVLGGYQIGDIVTLLIGMDGSAVDVISSDAYSGTYIGVVTNTGVSSYTDVNQVATAEKVIYVTCTDGTTRSFSTEDTYEKGDMVSVEFSGGVHQITRLNRRTIAGTVSRDGTTLGDAHKLAADVRILNLAQDGSAKRIYSSKLAGVTLYEGDVYYYKMNDSNEITDLILYNAVGEGRDYGIVISVEEKTDTSGITTYTYQYIVDGKTYEGKTTDDDIGYGAAAFYTDGGERKYFTDLTSHILSGVSGLTAYSGSTKYDISEEVQCYIKTDAKTYTKATMNTMDAEKYRLSGYLYDQSIRIIVAEEK